MPSSSQTDVRRPADKVTAGKPRLVAQLGHLMGVTAVAFSPDARFIVTAGYDDTAVLWDTATGKELRRFIGHSDTIAEAVFSPDGTTVLTASWDKTARLWQVATGEEIRRFEGHQRGIYAMAASADGRWLLTGSDDKTARLWEVATGKEARRFEGHAACINSVAFSADGRLVLTGSGHSPDGDNSARIWDAKTGKELHRLEGGGITKTVAFSPDGGGVLTGGEGGNVARLWDARTGKEARRFDGRSLDQVNSVAFSPDGRFVLTGSTDTVARLWDTSSGKELRRFEGHSNWVSSVTFSADGRFVLTGSLDRTARLWEASTGKLVRRFQGNSDWIWSVAFSPDMRAVATASKDTVARLWDLTAGKQSGCFEQHSDMVTCVAFSPDGRWVLSGSNDNAACLWEAKTCKGIRCFTGDSGDVKSVAFSPDGRFVLTGNWDKTARLWDANAGKEVRRFEGHSDKISSVAFSADGRWVLTGSWDRTARLWDAHTGKELRRFSGHRTHVNSVAISSDGRWVLTGSLDDTARLWESSTGKEVRRFEGHTDGVDSVAFSSDGGTVLTGSSDKTARLWVTATGKEVRRFEGHADDVNAAVFSPDGRFVLTGSSDGTARLWEAKTGNELCRLISFRDGTWAVVDSTGRFDAANGGKVQGLHWVIANESIALDQLKDRYYDPGLLAKHLGFNKEPLREVASFSNPKLFPSVSLTLPTPEKPHLGIQLKNRDGGIGRVVVRINGKELTADARRPGADPNARELVLPPIDLTDDPRLIPGEENLIEVFAYNAEGYLRSRGYEVTYKPPRGRAATEQKLWGVVAGVSDYSGSGIDLRYAAKDADDFAAALRLAAGRLFVGNDKVHVTLLSTSQPDRENWPTRNNLLRAFETVKAGAKSTDVLVVYLSGHGVNHGGQEGDFHFLTSDANTADLSDPEVRERAALSSQQLTELIRQIPALKQVIVLDTCASGRVIEKLTDERNIPSSQIRALERMKDRTGTYVLAGCAADRVSYEATRYAQGLLTYSLLLGMRGPALRDGQFVDVTKLFPYAADQVPQLAKDIGGRQDPLLAVPSKAQPFDIGRLTDQDKTRIPLQAVRPLFQRSSFQAEKPPRDVLGLGRRVDDLLRETSARGRDIPLVFVDVVELPESYQLTGRYRLDGERVTATVNLYHGDKEVTELTVMGDRSRVDDMAAKIVEEATRRLKK
jgi:WD40 repeat protein/uncharacterized caspase-like protein